MDLLDDVDSHVLDLPQLYTKPSAGDILRGLERLALKPQTFSNDGKALAQKQIHSGGVCHYLTSIISSTLAWIDSDESKEQVWKAASTRLCERSGRSAMPSISRELVVPMEQGKDISVTLHEPSLTSDNLGMKTWVSSYLLAKRLHEVFDPSFIQDISASKPNGRLHALELGAGTGLVGISFAALWGEAASVHLTDLEPIVPNLAHNVGLNQDLLSKTGSSVSTGVLDWALETGDLPTVEPQYDIVLAADPLYSPEHPGWLVQTIRRRLSSDIRSRVLVEMPLRDAYLPQVADFKHRMQDLGLRVLDGGEEVGYDDWESSDGGALEVRCWWSLWAWDAQKVKKLDDG